MDFRNRINAVLHRRMPGRGNCPGLGSYGFFINNSTRTNSISR